MDVLLPMSEWASQSVLALDQNRDVGSSGMSYLPQDPSAIEYEH